MKNSHFCSLVGLFLVSQLACTTSDDSISLASGKGGAVSETGGAAAGAGGGTTLGGSGGTSFSQQGGASDAGAALGGRPGTGGISVSQSDASRDTAGDTGSTDSASLGGKMGTGGATTASSLGGRDAGAAGGGGSTGTVDVPAAGGTTSGSFPRSDANPTLQSVSGAGPYEYQSYSSGFSIAGAAFTSATIFYPTTAKPPFAAIAFCPGFTEIEAGFLTWGQVLASHGIVALIFTPQNTLMDLPEARGDQLLAALDTLVAENSRADGPLNGKLATDRFGVMGHSMGGGGTLFACNKGSNRIKAAVPLMPWQPLGTFPSCTAPTLLVAAENDSLVNPDSMAYPEYQSLGATDKVYMEVAGADHVAANDVSAGNNLYVRYGLSWLKLHLEDDTRYAQFLTGDPHKADVAANVFVKFEP